MNNRAITTKGKVNFVKIYEVDKKAPNIIFIMTPIGSVSDEYVSGIFKGLINKECNVFAIDFLGIGKSEGSARDINLKNMENSIISLIEFIESEYSNNIHFYGGTGAGGIIGQYLVSLDSIGNRIQSFIQFGVYIKNDSTVLGKTSTLRALHKVLGIVNIFAPGSRVKFTVPEYEGLNSEKEAEWYKSIQEINPVAFDFKVALFKSLLDIFFSKKKNSSIELPKFVIAPKYDRYYYREYINRYYNSINGKKELYWHEGSHISFDWDAEIINTKVLNWVRQISRNM